MKRKSEESKKAYLYRALYIVTVAAALFPVSCNYIMSGGIVTEWIARMQELGAGIQERHLWLFPSSETIVSVGIRANAMNSNLWFWVPGFLYRWSGNIVLAYRIYMTGIQVGTFFASCLLFKRVFAKGETELPVFFGTLLYMTCPYRIYVCYDLANLSQAAAWMVLPLYLWAVWGIAAGEKKFWNVAVAAFAMAGIGYADTVFFITALGMTLLAGVISRKIRLFVSAAGGIVLFLPGLQRLARYVFLDHYYELDMPLQSIMPSGYRIGQFFSSYSFRDGHPGMGLGMLVCLLALIWIRFVENMKESNKESKICLAGAFFFVLLSTCYFPWDIIQRIGKWGLKTVCLIGTPAVFWGMAFLCLCVPAADTMGKIGKHENKKIAFAVPVIVWIACICICVYQCNMITYHRVPLELP